MASLEEVTGLRGQVDVSAQKSSRSFREIKYKTLAAGPTSKAKTGTTRVYIFNKSSLLIIPRFSIWIIATLGSL